MLALEGTTQGALQEACATLKDQAPPGGSPKANQVVGEALSEVAVNPAFLARLAKVSPSRARIPEKIVLSS